MGPTLTGAADMRAYTLTDRGTWLGLRDRGLLVVPVEGDPRLFNP
jgi:tungstate transport system substrate-binding protein